MTRTIDLETVATTIRQVVAEKGPEYTYPRPKAGHGCYYRQPHFDTNNDGLDERLAYSDGAPGCIVGHVLDRLGILPERLGGSTAATAGIENSDARGAIRCLSVLLDFEMDGVAVRALKTAQRVQDDGFSWGSALEQYEQSVRFSTERAAAGA